jgi:hypothetical protein
MTATTNIDGDVRSREWLHARRCFVHVTVDDGTARCPYAAGWDVRLRNVEYQVEADPDAGLCRPHAEQIAALLMSRPEPRRKTA